VPCFLCATGHKALVYREPYGVALVMEPFNGPLLMIRPALTALAAGNTCVPKLHPGLTATSPLLLGLVPRYFDPRRSPRSPVTAWAPSWTAFRTYAPWPCRPWSSTCAEAQHRNSLHRSGRGS
jgi:hypothetical protein